MKLIVLAGKAGSGKDTFATFLNNHLDYERYAFAGPLKDACCLLFGWTREQIDNDRDFKETIDPRWGFSPRKAMQLMGTEYGREMLRPDIWIHMAQLRLDETQKKGLLVTDCRFENEAQWVRKNNGIIIHIERDETNDVLAHASEGGVSKVEGDLIVNNVGTLQHLEMVAASIGTSINSNNEKRIIIHGN